MFSKWFNSFCVAMPIDIISSVLLRLRPEKWGLCGFSSFRCLSGQLRWEKHLEGGRGTTKSNSAWRDTSSTENLNPNIQLWQSHKQLKTVCVVIEALCKWPVLQSQSLIKSCTSSTWFLLRLFSDGVKPLQQTTTNCGQKKSRLDGKNSPSWSFQATVQKLVAKKHLHNWCFSPSTIHTCAFEV